MITPVVRTTRFIIFGKMNPHHSPKDGKFTHGPGGPGRGGAPRDIAGQGAYAGGGSGKAPGKKAFTDTPKKPEKALAARNEDIDGLTDTQYKRYAATPKTLGHSDAMMFAKRPATAAQMSKFAALTETQKVAYRQGVNGKRAVPHADMLKVVSTKRTLPNHHEPDYAERLEFNAAMKKTGRSPLPPGHSAVLLHDDWRTRIPIKGNALRGPDGKSLGLLGTGLDSAGRMQYYYSKNHNDHTSKTKYNRVSNTEKNLPSLDKILAKAAGTDAGDVALLIRKTGIRPDSGGKTNAMEKAYGATTLQARHVVSISGNTVHFKYQAKDGVLADWKVTDPVLAKMIAKRKAAALRTGENTPLFGDPKKAYTGVTRLVQSSGVGKVKDLRTHIGTTTAMAAMRSMEAPKTLAEYKRATLAVATIVSQRLINRPGECLTSYIAPSVFAAWRAGLTE